MVEVHSRNTYFSRRFVAPDPVKCDDEELQLFEEEEMQRVVEDVPPSNIHLRFSESPDRLNIYTPTPPGSPDLFNYWEDERKYSRSNTLEPFSSTKFFSLLHHSISNPLWVPVRRRCLRSRCRRWQVYLGPKPISYQRQ